MVNQLLELRSQQTLTFFHFNTLDASNFIGERGQGITWDWTVIQFNVLLNSLLKATKEHKQKFKDSDSILKFIIIILLSTCKQP